MLCFFSLNLLPGSPAQAILGVAGSSPHAVAALNHKLGVDQPLLHRFVTWIGNVVHGDLGNPTSRVNRSPTSSARPRRCRWS